MCACVQVHGISMHVYGMCMCCVHKFCKCACGVGVLGGGLSSVLHTPLLLPSPFLPLLPLTQLTGAIYCDRALRMNGFTGEGVQSGTVLVVKAHSVTPRWITTKKIDFDSKVTRLCIVIVARCSQLVLVQSYQVTV